MFQQFTHALAENLADILTFTLVVGLLAGGTLFYLARRRHVAAIRRRLHGQVSMPGRVRETLARVLNADVAEMGAIGAVSFVDIAWQYSMADPSIWDHFDGPAAAHMADAIQNLDVLKEAFGSASLTPFVDHVVEWLRGLEALHVFSDLADRLPVIGDSAALVVEGKSASLVDSLVNSASTVHTAAEAKAGATFDGGLQVHIPFVSIGFAAYRAWRRAQKGAGLPRNVEFAAIEVATRATGGLVGGKVGGVIGTAIVPGAGTVVGAVAGAVAGAVGGAALGEAIKKRHVQKANREYHDRLEQLGAAYLDDDAGFEQVTGVFRQQEEQYMKNLSETRRRLRRYALPWRVIWPDEKLVLLGETVRLAENRLGTVQQGTIDAIDRLNFMRATGQRRELGAMLWSNPALAQEVPCDPELIGAVRQASDRLKRELAQLGLQPSGAAA